MRATPINRLGCAATTFAISSFAILQAFGFKTRRTGDEDTQQYQTDVRGTSVDAPTARKPTAQFAGEKPEGIWCFT